MKITKKHDDGCTYFHELAQGDVFFYQNHAYMKIPPIETVGDGDNINAISLEDGDIEAFYETERVRKVNAELIVEF